MVHEIMLKHTLKKEKFWEELIAYFPLIRTDRVEKDTSKNSLPPRERFYQLLPSNDKV
jgi:hypothetical protein